MTAGGRPPVGISVIEKMAAEHHDRQGLARNWDQLSTADRVRLMTFMEAAVEVIPDRLLLKYRGAAETYKTRDCRRAILADHRHAKKSVIYGQ